ncbi:MAG: hypothetical protein ACLP41_06295 [Acidimicrobiales bacterium]
MSIIDNDHDRLVVREQVDVFGSEFCGGLQESDRRVPILRGEASNLLEKLALSYATPSDNEGESLRWVFNEEQKV